MTYKNFKEVLHNYFTEGIDAFLPHISVNCVVLAYQYPELKVLIHKIGDDGFGLIPGGYVKKAESVEEAAYRNLEILGINEVFLRQVQTFGETDRAFQYSSDLTAEILELESEIVEWVRQRFISVVYYGLVNFTDTKVKPGGLIQELEWITINNLDNLVMDHAKIVLKTQKLLATELLNYPVLSNLLPEHFTLNELRGLFEAILSRPIDRGTFRRKMLNLGLIDQVDKRKDVLGRPSHIFRFQKENYARFLQTENKFGF